MPPNVDTEPDPVRERLYKMDFDHDVRDWLVETTDDASLLNLSESRLRGYVDRHMGPSGPFESSSGTLAGVPVKAIVAVGAALAGIALLGGGGD